MKNFNRSGTQSRIAELLNYYNEEKRKMKSNEMVQSTKMVEEDCHREPFRQLPQPQIQQQVVHQSDIKEIGSDDINDFMEDLKRGCLLERHDDASDEVKEYIRVASQHGNEFIPDQYDDGSHMSFEFFENMSNEEIISHLRSSEVLVQSDNLEQDVEAILNDDDDDDDDDDELEHLPPNNLNFPIDDIDDSELKHLQEKQYIYFSSDSQDVEERESKPNLMSLIYRDVSNSTKSSFKDVEERESKPTIMSLIYRDVSNSTKSSFKTSPKLEQKKVTFTNMEVQPICPEVADEVALDEHDIERCGSDEPTLDTSFDVEKSQHIVKRKSIDMSEIVQDIIADVQHAAEDVFSEKFDNSHLQIVPKLVAVEIWSESINSVIKGLQQLADISLRPKGQKDILDAGGHLAIVVIMKRWSNSPDVLIEACNTLEKASRFTPSFAQSAVSVGALEVILNYMSEYKNDERVQAYGCGALCALAWSKPAAELFVFHLKGINTFYQAMTTFPYCTLLLQNACWYFNHISAWEKFRGPTVFAGILGTLSNAIETYTANENVEKIIQLNAREAVQRLVSF